MELLNTTSGKTDNVLVQTLLATVPLVTGNSETAGPMQQILANRPLHSRAVEDWRLFEIEVPASATPAEIAPATAVAIKASDEKPGVLTAKVADSVVNRDESASTLSQHRIWTSGRYTANAEFVSLEGNMVRLRRTTGVRTSIPLEKLSLGDQQWIANRLASR